MDRIVLAHIPELSHEARALLGSIHFMSEEMPKYLLDDPARELKKYGLASIDSIQGDYLRQRVFITIAGVEYLRNDMGPL